MIEGYHAYGVNVAKNYDSDREHEEHWVKENDFIKQYFEKKQADILLDIPIGTGRFLEYYPPQSKILGVDISCPMIEQAQQKIFENEKWRFNFKVGDAKNLDFVADCSADVVVCCRLLHLIRNRERIEVLKEFSRVLKGDLILQTYLDLPKENIIIRFIKRSFRLINRLFFVKHERTFSNMAWSHIKSYSLSEEKLKDMANVANLKIVSKVHLCYYSGTDVSIFILRKL